MYHVQATGPDRIPRVVPLTAEGVRIGRGADNHLVLDGQSISSRHCTLTYYGHQVLLTDESTNGTYVNNVEIHEPVFVNIGDRIFVGSFLVELIPAPVERRQPVAIDPAAPILRGPDEHQTWYDTHSRLQRYATEWDRSNRPHHLALRADELRSARQWLQRTPAELTHEITSLQREYIAHSGTLAQRRFTRRLVGFMIGATVLGAIIATSIMIGPSLLARRASLNATENPPPPSPERHTSIEHAVSVDDVDLREGAASLDDNDESDCGAFDPDNPDKVCVDLNESIQHRIIPFETLDDIARRYDVTVADIADWNLVNPDAELSVGKFLEIRNPQKRPLPQTKVTYEVEPGETWTKLAERFDLSATRLRSYNDGATDLKPGASIDVWIDPRPYVHNPNPGKIPDYILVKDAQSVGGPGNGQLENGIQLPPSDLYIRRYPNIMWGSGLTIQSLQRAVAAFRQDIDYQGELILADISKKHGGHFPPHKSHQAGRDIDIWLPTLKGVYKRKYLGDGDRVRPRKPHFEEVDWYATWSLVKALIETETVKYVFLDWRYQKYVYDAAVNMGATQEELDEWIQYPRHQSSPRGIFRHSKDHLSHIHVRFKCADYESTCVGSRATP